MFWNARRAEAGCNITFLVLIFFKLIALVANVWKLPVNFPFFIITFSNLLTTAKLEKVMLKSGVPKEIINNYVTYIKAACNNYPNLVSNKLIEVVWRFGNSPEAGVIKHKIIRNNKELENKMINPNAKIVKTLNKLFQKEDK